jgi:hypothetical protein
LKRFPENGWALFGLLQALHAQGKTADADATDARFRSVAGKGRDADRVTVLTSAAASR